VKFQSLDQAFLNQFTSSRKAKEYILSESFTVLCCSLLERKLVLLKYLLPNVFSIRQCLVLCSVQMFPMICKQSMQRYAQLRTIITLRQLYALTEDKIHLSP